MLLVIAVAACTSSPGAAGPGAAGPEATGTATPEDAIAGLLETLRDDPDPRERLEAVEGLAEARDRRVGPALETALSDEDVDVRSAAARVLGDRGDVHAVKPLATALTAELRGGGASNFLEAAATALGELGGAGGVPALIDVLASGDGAGRSAALKAMAAIGSAALPALKKALADGEVTMRLAAIDGLSALGKLGVKPLIGALKDDEAKVRSAAANRLGRLGDRSAAAPLVALLENPEWRTVSIALARLYRDAPVKLLPYLRSKETLGAYYGLILLGSDDTVAALVTALKRLGDVDMAEDYLNCGSDALEEAAHDWADDHGYTVTTVPGSGDSTWGSGLPE